jgi:Leucine-rich repeat (LRR) protein
MPQLTHLSLNNNPINSLPSGVFTSLQGLMFITLSNTNIVRLNSNAFGWHPQLFTFWIRDSHFDELQHGFFNAFPLLDEFDSRGNRCTDEWFRNTGSIDFNNDTRLHQCFANWFVSRP